MHIGISLQSLNLRAGGVRIYTEEVVSHLLQLDRYNEYILLYPGFGVARHRSGQYSTTYKNVTEVVTGATSISAGLYWDQLVLPRIARQYSIDVLFNPFLSVPVAGRFKKVMVMHNVEYHLIPKVYDWKMNVRWWFLETAILPAADRVISISNVMTQDFRRTVKYPIDKVRTVYHGVSKKFQVIRDTEILQGMKAKYQLPDVFLLFVGHIYPQKNFGNFVRALHLLVPAIPHRLVVVGRPRWRYQEALQTIDELKLQDRIQFLNEVENDDLPAIYNLATCLVYPSLYESFGLVQLEAMACGCPVAGANAGAIPEISGGAALLFDPHQPDDMAAKILRLVQEPKLRDDFIEKGLARAREFTWERCAAKTLQVLQEVVRN